MKNILAAFLFILSSYCFNYAQTVLSLENAVEIALSDSYDARSASYSLQSSQKRLRAVELGLRTSINLNLSLPSYSDYLQKQWNSNTLQYDYYKTKTTELNGDLSLTQPILPTNGTLSVIGRLNKLNQESAFSSRENYLSDLIITLRQPIFSFNDLDARLTRAEIGKVKAERNYSQQEFNIIYNVTQSYFSLMKAKKNVEITEESLKQTKLSYTTAVNKFKAGLIAEVDALNQEVQFAKQQNSLLQAQNNFEEAMLEFKFLVGLALDETIDISSELTFLPVTVDVDDAINNALIHRPDILNASNDIELSELSLDEADSKNNIQFDLFAQYGINKSDSTFGNIFSGFLNNRRVNLTVSIPVFDWGKASTEIEEAEINLKQSVERHKNLLDAVRKEIISSVNRLNSAKAQIEINSKSVLVAEKSYNISLERFKSGKITSFELSQAQLDLINAKKSNLDALIDYKIAVADLERKTLTKYSTH